MALQRLSKAARVILVGAPGVGKGTQSERLMQKFSEIKQLSSGDLLRKNVKEKTRAGLEAESIMKSGKLVSDSLILRLITDELTTRGWIQSGTGKSKYTFSDQPSASFILDGFPRTAVQAVQLDDIVPINLVVNLNTPTDIIIDRICNRWIHEPSGRVYNTTFNAPKADGKDDVTGEALVRRADDDPEVWKARLKSFKETSTPLLEHYDKLGILWTVNGNSSDEITPQIFEEFGKRFGVP
ncbi:adenylate kinase [Dothidotthia symphoricarpi CBS 119687]|uniref:GTP:AMP phosphotransferase, mitochondrial n=1 Tax=Dothidotthia symphoricarpi CBS 119687 TaxID=1392245 RepID=A0A6A6ALF7_9PLEO|nr:adenylate kinase [Dothidotthia symphoricarpi CBS 119687]KAF2132789.1 adenylate kinase [Dothidotthia symphoricarpi CBS 119687]